jgi:hypothetical protein
LSRLAGCRKHDVKPGGTTVLWRASRSGAQGGEADQLRARRA